MKRIAIMWVLVLGLVGTSAVAVAQDNHNHDHKHDHAHDAPKPGAKPDVAAPAQTPESEAAQHKERIRFLLSGYEYFPSRADLEKVTPDAPTILMEFANAPGELPSTRLRALDALGLFEQDNRVASFFETMLAQGKNQEKYLRHAITSSLKACGTQALPWVQPYLQHTDTQMRISAVYALGRLGGKEGVAMLRTHQGLETNATVKAQMSRFLEVSTTKPSAINPNTIPINPARVMPRQIGR